MERNPAFNILGGLKFYFGGEDKSLIRRHREDDPAFLTQTGTQGFQQGATGEPISVGGGERILTE